MTRASSKAARTMIYPVLAREILFLKGCPTNRGLVRAQYCTFRAGAVNDPELHTTVGMERRHMVRNGGAASARHQTEMVVNINRKARDEGKNLPRAHPHKATSLTSMVRCALRGLACQAFGFGLNGAVKSSGNDWMNGEMGKYLDIQSFLRYKTNDASNNES